MAARTDVIQSVSLVSLPSAGISSFANSPMRRASSVISGQALVSSRARDRSRLRPRQGGEASGVARRGGGRIRHRQGGRGSPGASPPADHRARSPALRKHTTPGRVVAAPWYRAGPHGRPADGVVASLEADSSWMAWSAANVLISLERGHVPWDAQKLIDRDMPPWPRYRAGPPHAVAIMTSGDRRPSLLSWAASSDSADHRWAAKMLISAIPRLDPNGSIEKMSRRDADLPIRPKDVHQVTPAPTRWSCNRCRTVQALDTEDFPGCDDGVRPRPEE